MKVIIPLAGFGTRLRPLTYTRAKPLINVAGKAVLGHILDKLASLTIDEYVFIVGYLGEQIEDYVRKNYAITAHFVEQKVINGQAAAVLLARKFVQGPVLIVFVDTLFETDLSKLNAESADGVIYVKEVQDPRRFGVVKLDEEGFITGFVEKPSTYDNRLAVIGMYYLKDSLALMNACQRLIDLDIQTKGEYFLADAFNLMIESGARFRTEEVGVWADCGKPETVLETNRYLLRNGHDNSHEFASEREFQIIPPVHIAPTAQIENSVIGPHATIAGHCTVKGSIVRDSIVDEYAHIENITLDQSLIGQYALVKSKYYKLNVGDSSVVDFS
jgi:glucose-1-phosphate thymidylyltransferase